MHGKASSMDRATPSALSHSVAFVLSQPNQVLDIQSVQCERDGARIPCRGVVHYRWACRSSTPIQRFKGDTALLIVRGTVTGQ